MPGVSDNIAVRSVVGRFLEHSRVYRFENGGRPEIYLASADWMARNFFRRVETCFPIEDADLRAHVDQILETYWHDNVRAREQGLEPTYERMVVSGDRIDSQGLFLENALRKKPDVDSKPLVVKATMKEPSRRDEKVGQPA
jgi:polyphosphate kinase